LAALENALQTRLDFFNASRVARIGLSRRGRSKRKSIQPAAAGAGSE